MEGVTLLIVQMWDLDSSAPGAALATVLPQYVPSG